MQLWSPLRLGVLVVAAIVGSTFAFAAFGQRTAQTAIPALIIPALIGFGIALCALLVPSATSGRLRTFLGWAPNYRVFDEMHPRFRFVDLYRAIKVYAEKAQAYEWLEAHFPQQQNLVTLLSPGFFAAAKRPERSRLCIGYNEYDFFPNEIFCLVVGPAGRPAHERLLLRLCQRQYRDVLEVAAADVEQAGRVMEEINELAATHSIYRGQFLEIRPNVTGMTDYNYAPQPGELSVKFKQRPQITAADIVLDERIHAVLRRTLFDFFTHRQQLQALGLPKKRTLLLYGPPGTGKTHTCRYVQTTLENITTIQVSGQAVSLLSEIGKFARQLHPALVILEDIDLVFTQREINVYATVLGELMDQLDGFNEDEEVLFILTTNAIERVEQAIKDRPGRVNQCLYFGLPTDDLRRLYLERYLQPYQSTGVDLDHLVRQTENTSQAFLKEYVQRAVQVAAADVEYVQAKLALETRHFDTAFDELTSHGDPHGHSIMGFHRGKS